MATVQSINPAAAARVRDVIDSVSCDLSYIGELAALLVEGSDATANNPNRLEALARGICLLQQSIQSELDRHLQQAV